MGFLSVIAEEVPRRAAVSMLGQSRAGVPGSGLQGGGQGTVGWGGAVVFIFSISFSLPSPSWF